jgi:hypothetical protein
VKRYKALTAAACAVAVSALALMGGAASGATPAGALPTLNLTMTGNAISATSSVPSGAVNVVMNNSGEKESSPFLVRLNPGVTFAQAFGAVQAHHGDANYLSGLASIVFDFDSTAPTSSAQTQLTPGNYVAVDAVKSNPAKWPHTQFTVTQSASPAMLPAPKAKVGAIEFAFTGPSTLHRGQLVRFSDNGFLSHMIIAIGVKNRQGAKGLTALLRAGKDNKAQKFATSFVTFLGTSSPGAMQQEAVTAKPGMYVLACFMTTQDGREHTRLGMERTIRVVK